MEVMACSIACRRGREGRSEVLGRGWASGEHRLHRSPANWVVHGVQGGARVQGKKRGTAERRRLALFVSDSSSDPDGREELWREITPWPIDDVEENQRGMREGWLGFI
jgi:hypothetical protein